MSAPQVDVVIAVHSASRPIHRAAASVLEHTAAAVRVIVVAHNIDPDVIRSNLGDLAEHPGLTLLSLRDDIPSPAGPMNHGLAHATAPFVALLGSDDEFAPGALDSWLAVQRETGASAVIPKIVIAGRPWAPLPPVRRGTRSRRLSARRDRLSYRTAPLGLIDRERFGHLRFTEGIPTGEDIAFSAELWFRGRNLAIDREGPSYVVHEDAGDRVTSDPRPVPEEFAYLDELERAPWLTSLRRADRIALVSKLIRMQVIGAILARRERIAEHQTDLRTVLDRLEAMAPGVLGVLSRIERKILDETFAATPDPERILALSYDRWTSRSLGTALTRNPLRSLHPQAMLRFLDAAGRVGTA